MYSTDRNLNTMGRTKGSKNLKRKAETELEGQPQQKKIRLMSIYNNQEQKLVKTFDPVSGRKNRAKPGPGKNLFLFIYDEGWTFAQKELENIKAVVGGYCKFKAMKKSDVYKLQLLKSLRDYCISSKDNEVLKVIVYYSGHGRQIGNEEFPSIKVALGDYVNTKDLFDDIVKINQFSLVVFIADTCNSTPKSPEAKVQYFEKSSSKTNYFDFQGSCYIRTCQPGRASYGHEKFGGSYFVRCFLDLWDGSWENLVEVANILLYKYQFATGLGFTERYYNREVVPKINLFEKL